MYVSVNGEELTTTPEHPFYVPQKGWTEAAQLRAGDILVLQSGEYVVVELIQHEILEEPIVVYNFEVEGFHTYYVGRNTVLVHNSCKAPENLAPAGVGRQGAFRQAKRDMGIPVSQQPDMVLPNYNRRGMISPGRVYVFGDILIRDDLAGHIFGDGGYLYPHFNTPVGGHYFYD